MKYSWECFLKDSIVVILNVFDEKLVSASHNTDEGENSGKLSVTPFCWCYKIIITMAPGPEIKLTILSNVFKFLTVVVCT